MLFKNPLYDPPIIAVDLDGTIIHNEYPDLGEPIEGAREALNTLKAYGYKIAIWTCRTNEEDVREHLMKHDIPFDAINDNSAITDEDMEKYGFDDSRKIGADLYIEDKGLTFNGDWDEVLQKFKESWYNDGQKHNTG